MIIKKKYENGWKIIIEGWGFWIEIIRWKKPKK